MNATTSLAEAKAALHGGQIMRARDVLERLLASTEANNAEVWQLLAICLARTQDFPGARNAINNAIRLQPAVATYRLTAANIEQDLGDRKTAIRQLTEALRIQPAFPEAHNNLGILQSEAGDLEAAKRAFLEATRLRPGYARAWSNLAGACLQQSLPHDAEQAAQKAIAADANHAHGYQTLGQACLALDRPADAERAFRQALRVQPNNVDALLLLVRVLARRNLLDDAIANLGRALTLAPNRHDLWILSGDLAAKRDDLVAARQDYSQALSKKAHDLEACVKLALVLPHIYETGADVAEQRKRFQSGLDSLEQNLARMLPAASLEALPRALRPSFLLAYQACNDLELQRRFAGIASAVVGHLLPEFTARMPPRPVSGRRIRIGFCSRFFYGCTTGHYFASWVTGLDKGKFEIFVYFSRATGDDLTASIRAAADHFVQEEATLPGFARRIREDELDILIYPELGMDPIIYLLATMRLAPVQLCAWGHPVTTGLHRTIDAFISCREMEPENARDHYCEELLLLPGMGTQYTRPASTSQAASLSRADFQLPSDRTLYLMPQSLFKIHPDNDTLIAELLARHRSSQLVCFEGENRWITSRFVARLSKALARKGLNPSECLKLLPVMPHDKFRRVNQLCDVMIDTLHWSGGHTSIDAISAGLPIVTLPGTYMRGRQSMAMLRMLDCPGLIASDTKEYVDIAVEIGSNSRLREEYSQRFHANWKKVFEDVVPCAALAEMLMERVASPL